jgi:hypothetical protein
MISLEQTIKDWLETLELKHWRVARSQFGELGPCLAHGDSSQPGYRATYIFEILDDGVEMIWKPGHDLTTISATDPDFFDKLYGLLVDVCRTRDTINEE